MGSVASIFYGNLIQVLRQQCPFRTGNMLNHITYEQTPDYYAITIEAPVFDKAKKSVVYDYSQAVNEGLAAKAQNRARSAKEERNYHWVQRSCKQAASLTAEKVSYSGGYSL